MPTSPFGRHFTYLNHVNIPFGHAHRPPFLRLCINSIPKLSTIVARGGSFTLDGRAPLVGSGVPVRTAFFLSGITTHARRSALVTAVDSHVRLADESQRKIARCTSRAEPTISGCQTTKGGEQGGRAACQRDIYIYKVKSWRAGLRYEPETSAFLCLRAQNVGLYVYSSKQTIQVSKAFNHGL